MTKKEEILKILALNIKYYRVKANFTVKQLAEKSKIRKEYLYKIEKGKAYGMHTGHLFAICEALNVEPYKLVMEK